MTRLGVQRLLALVAEAGLPVEHGERFHKVGRDGGPRMYVGTGETTSRVHLAQVERVHRAIVPFTEEPRAKDSVLGVSARLDFEQGEAAVLEAFLRVLDQIREAPAAPKPAAAHSAVAQRGAAILASIEESRATDPRLYPVPTTPPPVPKVLQGAQASEGPSPETLEALVTAAVAARARAYAPYSRFTVGAAVLARDGRVYTGANVENASYPLSVCAERNAIAAAALDGARELVAMVVATPGTPPVSPCGGCRQVLAEFAREAVVLLVDEKGDRVRTSLGELLPRAFRGETLRS